MLIFRIGNRLNWIKSFFKPKLNVCRLTIGGYSGIYEDSYIIYWKTGLVIKSKDEYKYPTIILANNPRYRKRYGKQPPDKM